MPAQLIAAAREAGRTVIVDPKGPDYSRYAGADIIMPNRSDLAEATGMRVDTEAAIVAAATALRQRHGFGAVLVTRGNDGMTLLDDGGALHFPAEAVEVYDIAGAATRRWRRWPRGSRRDWSCRWRCGSPTSRPASWWVRSALRWRVKRTCWRRCRRRAARCARSSRGRRRWSTCSAGITAAGGSASSPACFDTLAPPDLYRLEEAREACDRLVVALQSPLAATTQTEAARAAMLASLASVDLVTTFADGSPDALIANLRPDVIIRSAPAASEVLTPASRSASPT